MKNLFWICLFTECFKQKFTVNGFIMFSCCLTLHQSRKLNNLTSHFAPSHNFPDKYSSYSALSQKAIIYNYLLKQG